jgi:hypothetical protein
LNAVLFVTLVLWIGTATVGLILCAWALHTAHHDKDRVNASKRTDLRRARLVIIEARVRQERIAVAIQYSYLYTGLAIVLSQSGTAWRWTWPLALIAASILQVVASYLRNKARAEALRVLDEELSNSGNERSNQNGS